MKTMAKISLRMSSQNPVKNGDVSQGSPPSPVETRPMTEEEKERYGMAADAAGAAGTEKTCVKCGETKPLIEFQARRDTCLACVKAARKETAQKNGHWRARAPEVSQGIEGVEIVEGVEDAASETEVGTERTHYPPAINSLNEIAELISGATINGVFDFGAAGVFIPLTGMDEDDYLLCFDFNGSAMKLVKNVTGGGKLVGCDIS